MPTLFWTAGLLVAAALVVAPQAAAVFGRRRGLWAAGGFAALLGFTWTYLDGDAPRIAPSSNGSGQKRTYNVKSPNFLNDLDLSKAKKPLKEVIEEKMEEFKILASNFSQHLGVTRDQFFEAACLVRSRAFLWSAE